MRLTPTEPSPSPTTTSAVNENRRPPLTTLATRLVTTIRSSSGFFSTGASRRPSRPPRRSRRSPPARSPVPPARSPPPKPPRCAPGIRYPSRSCSRMLWWNRSSSELQSGAAGAVRQRGNAPVIGVATAIKDGCGHPCGDGALADQLADLAGLGALVPVGGTQVRLQGRGRGERAAGRVVDQLGADVPGRASDHQTRSFRAANYLLAQPEVAPGPRGAPRVGNGGCHDHLPVFPTLRLTTSPAYRTPLPLYGSGLRSLRMFAATSPTCRLSMPSTRNLIGDSTTKVMPFGASTGTGCE